MTEEVFQGYSDTFEVASNPYGMVINFNLSPPSVKVEQSVVARIRVSFEMAKVLTFMMLRNIKTRESQTGVSYPIASEILSNLKIAKEDWDALWASQKLDKWEDK